MSEFPSLIEAKTYAEKKGYKYAHLWFNDAQIWWFFNTVKKDWRKSMAIHEENCKRSARHGQHIRGGGLYAPIIWKEVTDD